MEAGVGLRHLANGNAYQQTCGAIAVLYEFAPQEGGEGAEAANQNGQAVEEELVEA